MKQRRLRKGQLKQKPQNRKDVTSIDELRSDYDAWDDNVLDVDSSDTDSDKDIPGAYKRIVEAYEDCDYRLLDSIMMTLSSEQIERIVSNTYQSNRRLHAYLSRQLSQWIH